MVGATWKEKNTFDEYRQEFIWLHSCIHLVIVAPEPLVPVLPDVGGVVPGLYVADVVDDGEQRVHVVSHGALVLASRRRLALVVVVPYVGDEGSHV